MEYLESSSSSFSSSSSNKFLATSEIRIKTIRWMMIVVNGPQNLSGTEVEIQINVIATNFYSRDKSMYIESMAGTMRIPERINEFMGFGSTKAVVRFMGIEERLIFHENATKDESLRRQIRIRKMFGRTMDLEDAIQFRLGFPLWHKPNAKIQKTYHGMVGIMLGIISSGNERIFRNNELQRRYQCQRLGRANGTTLISELFPLPLEAHNGKDWPILYRDEFGIESLQRYLINDATRRRGLLKSINAPITVCYGKRHWADFKILFDETEWQKEGPVEFGMHDQTLVILVSHFTAFGSLYFRVQKVVEIILKNIPQIAHYLTTDRAWLDEQEKIFTGLARNA
jgi:hypothetical protein